MKKVGLLTIHAARNYGAALQTYATQKNIKDAGAESTIIDFLPANSKRNLKFLRFDPSKSAIKHNIRNLLKPSLFFKRKKLFNEFKESKLSVTKKSYNANNLNAVASEGFDCLITGSDQTFNLHLDNNLKDRKCFFMPEIQANKISYSASMGDKIGEMSAEERAFIKTALSKYSALSVREETGADFLEEILGKRPLVLADPTLAVSKEHWENEFAKPYPNLPEKYILFYTVLSKPWVIDAVKEISRQTGLPIVAAHPQNSFEISEKFIRANDAGPEHFVYMIQHATLVVTTSFHGTAFSTKLNKPFVSLVLGEGARIMGLLRNCSLEHRALREVPNADFDFFNIDFSCANEYFTSAHEQSINFLKKALETE